MDMRVIGSELISKVKRSTDDSSKVEVTLTNGAKYEYIGIPENVILEWVDSESVGRYFNSHIKGKYMYNRLKKATKTK